MHQMPHQALESQPRKRLIQLLRAQGPVQGRDGTGDANETAMVWLASAAPKKVSGSYFHVPNRDVRLVRHP